MRATPMESLNHKIEYALLLPLLQGPALNNQDDDLVYTIVTRNWEQIARDKTIRLPH